jgi:23S rRNA pseudouridine1911/1915/1917 synthase
MRLSVSGEDSAARARLDVFVSEKTGITRSQVRKLMETGHILLNGRRVKPNSRVREDDAIEITLPEKEPGTLIPEDMPVTVLYSDSHLAVVDKPPGMVVYPSPGHRRGTLMNALSYSLGRLARVGGPLRPGVVHRLDKDTSGVMVVAMSDRAYYGLIEQFRKRTIRRSYLALVYGRLKKDRGEIALMVGRSAADRKKMSTRTRRGKEARTSWERLEEFSEATMIKAVLATGRTHQIRVHFASIGHPVLGDRTYGKKTSLEIRRPITGEKRSVTLTFPRQMLHAEVLGFTHPSTGEYMEFRTPLPADMAQAIRMLRGS